MKYTTLDDDTAICPEIIADRLTQDQEMKDLLCIRARWHYKHDPLSNFAKGCRGARKVDPRDHCAMFMQHWINAGIERLRKWSESR